RVHPGDHEHGMSLVHRPLDEGILLAQVEDVVLVDPWRNDDQRRARYLYRRGRVLDQLHEVVLENHLAWSRRNVAAELESRFVSHADAAPLDVSEQIVEAFYEVLAAR